MFKDLSIKSRVLLLTLLPSTLLACVLGGYFSWTQLSDLRLQIEARGALGGPRGEREPDPVR